MTRNIRHSLATACLMLAAMLPVPAAATQLLEAVDHGELSAEISATEVNRIALLGDRVRRVVRAPDGFTVEHDAATGDLWLRGVDATPSDGIPVTLFLGTEQGFTYRLTLTPSARDAAQILIRNADAMPDAQGVDDAAGLVPAGDPHIAALVKLVRAVARREPLPGYAIHAGGGASVSGFPVIETWRGPRLRALVFEADIFPSASADGPAGLAGTISGGIGTTRFADDARPADGAHLAALWLAAPGSGPARGRLAVAVVETAPAGAAR